MNTNMKLYQEFDSVYVKNYEPFKLMVIHFKGSFSGQMVSSGISVVKRNSIYILGVDLDPSKILFNYDGNFDIRRVFAYLPDGKRHYIKTNKRSDYVDKILSKWDDSTSKYEDFRRSNRGKPFRKTILRKRDRCQDK